MALRLVLVRHAKSLWDDPLIDDFDRPLNDRGRASSVVIGAWLVRHKILPDQVLSSSSLRTRQTWDHMGLSCPRTRFTDRLYHADPETLLAQLREASGECILLLAHNPGIAEFAQRFASAPLKDGEFSRYPTAATTIFDVSAKDWKDVDFGQNRIRDFVLPRSLL